MCVLRLQLYGWRYATEGSFSAHILMEVFVDNPESGTSQNTNVQLPRIFSADIPTDIAGANAAGWPSVLVKTGVYEPARGPPTHEPTYIAEDVEEAVRWAINREMGRK